MLTTCLSSEERVQRKKVTVPWSRSPSWSCRAQGSLSWCFSQPKHTLQVPDQGGRDLHQLTVPGIFVLFLHWVMLLLYSNDAPEVRSFTSAMSLYQHDYPTAHFRLFPYFLRTTPGQDTFPQRHCWLVARCALSFPNPTEPQSSISPACTQTYPMLMQWFHMFLGRKRGEKKHSLSLQGALPWGSVRLWSTGRCVSIERMRKLRAEQGDLYRKWDRIRTAKLLKEIGI